VDERTRRLLAVILATRSVPPPTMLAHVELLADLLRRHCGARIVLRDVLPAGEGS
jgi:hypothetical protein